MNILHSSNKYAYANIVQFFLDILMLIFTFCLSYSLASRLTVMWEIVEYLWVLIIFCPIWLSIMAFRGMYDKTTFYYLDRILRNVIFATGTSGLLLGAMFFFVKEHSVSRLFIGLFFILCIIVMFLERVVFSKVYKNSSNGNSSRIIVVCTRETWRLFYQYLKKTQIQYNIVGVVQVLDEEPIEGVKNLGNLEDLGSIISEQVVDEVVMSMPKNYEGGVEGYIHLCEQMGITVNLILDLYDLLLSHVRISMLGPMPMLTFNTVTLNPFQKAIKRSMDICGSLIGIAVTVILAIFIIPAIKLDSPGPVIFKQKRVGRHGRIFNVYKFRTMGNDAEAEKEKLMELNELHDKRMFKIKEDPRITRVGAFLRKTSLDEFPQFFNVFIGDMSLVGTRPPTLDEVGNYSLEQRRRISIKPGITGMWQVNGRSEIKNFEDVVALDTQYIDNWSIWLDINILMKTVYQVFKMKSAY